MLSAMLLINLGQPHTPTLKSIAKGKDAILFIDWLSFAEIDHWPVNVFPVDRFIRLRII